MTSISKTLNIHVDSGQLNQSWAKTLIKELIHHGVRTFCIAPGSRSTPLTMAIAENPLAKTCVHFDERGLAFHALGYAKSSQMPVALVVSSGTAVGNLLPAIMEAHHDHVPLIILSADRPPELRNVGANQTTDQVKIFERFTRFSFDFPCPDPAINQRFIGTTVAHAIQMALHLPKGPVHLNCMFREPFVANPNSNPGAAPIKENFRSQTFHIPTHGAVDPGSLDYLVDEFFDIGQGMILLGSMPYGTPLDPIINLAKRLKWPLLPDIMSGVRSEKMPDVAIPYYDTLLKSSYLHDELRPNFVLQFGDRFVSKKLHEYLAENPPERYFHISPHPDSFDQAHLITDRIECDPLIFCHQVGSKIEVQEDRSYLDTWKNGAKHVEGRIENFFQEQEGIHEPGVVRFLDHHLPQHMPLFIANSMPIRDADMFLFPKRDLGPIFANRGLSGIDGNIATSIGLSHGLEGPLVAVLGDLAFLHDVNSLAQLENHPHPMIFIVINNQGGGIFSFLPIAKKQSLFEKYFATPHNCKIKSAAELFDLRYYAPQSMAALEAAWNASLESQESTIIEIQTHRESNFHLHQDLVEVIKGEEVAKT